MKNQSDLDAIAEEAVGQRHDSAPPDAVREKEDISPEEAVRRIATSAGAQASISEKTAESVGERVGDAYSDVGTVAQTQKSNLGMQTATRAGSPASGAANPVLAAGRQVVEFVSRQFDEHPVMMTTACFALGYMTAGLLHGRINAYFGTTPGQFQITTPPQGDGHPRGFVQSTILKAITEHPQGMTTAEIIKELGPQGISHQSIANALGILVQAKKVSLQDTGGKYIPAGPEVPTAPDQPSS
jgi:hypothetical protein